MAVDNLEKWDLRFLRLSREISTWSKDKSTKTGAVIIDNERKIIGCGYNGFACGVEDSDERLDNRDIKYEMIIHCEVNAVLSADRYRLKGAWLYTWPFLSCSRCAALMIQSGISRIVAPKATPEQLERWGKSFELTYKQLDEAKVRYQLYDMKELGL